MAAASFSRSIQLPDRPAATAAARRLRCEATGQPEVAEKDDRRQHQTEREQPELLREPIPEDVVEADRSIPERVGPELDPDGEHQEEADDDHDDECRSEPGAQGWAAIVRAAGPDRPAGRSLAAAALLTSAALLAARTERKGLVRVAIVGIGRHVVVVARAGVRVGVRIPASGSGCIALGPLVIVNGALVGRIAGARVVGHGLAGRLGLTAPQLLHELVEQVSHSQRV